MPMSTSRQYDYALASDQQRSERVFSRKDLWYFKVREGEEVGPFRYKSEAMSNLDRFMEHLKQKVSQSG